MNILGLVDPSIMLKSDLHLSLMMQPTSETKKRLSEGESSRVVLFCSCENIESFKTSSSNSFLSFCNVLERQINREKFKFDYIKYLNAKERYLKEGKLNFTESDGKITCSNLKISDNVFKNIPDIKNDDYSAYYNIILEYADKGIDFIKELKNQVLNISAEQLGLNEDNKYNKIYIHPTWQNPINSYEFIFIKNEFSNLKDSIIKAFSDMTVEADASNPNTYYFLKNYVSVNGEMYKDMDYYFVNYDPDTEIFVFDGGYESSYHQEVELKKILMDSFNNIKDDIVEVMVAHIESLQSDKAISAYLNPIFSRLNNQYNVVREDEEYTKYGFDTVIKDLVEYLYGIYAQYVDVKVLAKIPFLKISGPNTITQKIAWTKTPKEFVELFAPLIQKGDLSLPGKRGAVNPLAEILYNVFELKTEKGEVKLSTIQTYFKKYNSEGYL